MRTALVILAALVGILYLKWALIFLVYPWQAFHYRYRKGGGVLWKVLGGPFWLLEKICRGGWQRFSLYQIGLIPSVHLRKWLYQGLGATCGPRSIFHFRTEIREPWKLRVGEGTVIGDNALLDAHNYLTLGAEVNLSSNVVIYTGQHDHRDPYFRSKGGKKSVEIGDRAWLGSNVLVLPGVVIGEGAVCCAGAVVTKDVAPYSVVAGIPAKPVGERPHDLRYKFSGNTCRFY